MLRLRGQDLHQQQSPRAPLHLKTTASSEVNSLHRMVLDRSSPKLEDGRSPRSPLHERKRGTRVVDLETKLGKAQEELKKLRDQLASAEVAKIDAEEALDKAKKQVFTVTRTPEVENETLSLHQESEPKPKPEPEPKSEVENFSFPPITEHNVAVATEPLEEQNKHKEEEVEKEKEKEKGEEDAKTMIQEDGGNDIEGMTEKVEEKCKAIELPESPEAVKLKAMILEKEKELEILLEENMIFKRRCEEEIKNLTKAVRAKEEDLKAKISSMEEELKESNARTAELAEQLAAAKGAKETLEVEMKRLRVQTEQWRKAAEAATALLATGDRGFREMGGRRVAERCRSMDKHRGGNVGWESPLMADEFGEDGGRRKSAGIRMFGDLWKKKVQQK